MPAFNRWGNCTIRINAAECMRAAFSVPESAIDKAVLRMALDLESMATRHAMLWTRWLWKAGIRGAFFIISHVKLDQERAPKRNSFIIREFIVATRNRVTSLVNEKKHAHIDAGFELAARSMDVFMKKPQKTSSASSKMQTQKLG